ncbi:MAG: hypothetical protein A2562_01300 [Candidatus Nealsonbacteria bacterium RIFOXYD1_FULL_39_11]|nr:MAG: hypothetical protein A2562_01300 [Candidatus Nealsonbacteria bacterium RIFOXYD1_FULL_39_11]
MNSMAKMKEFTPELNKIKAKHKNDKTKLMQAQAEFYKQKGINPGAGCLPYLLQIIVLIALFNVFTRVLASNGELVIKFNSLLYEPLKFPLGTQINTHFLYLDVTKPDILRLSILPFAIPGPLVIMAAVIQLISAKITMPYVKAEKKIAKATPEAGDDFQVAMQSSMIYTFPLMTLFIGMQFPSGLALYWLIFSLSQAYTQYRSSGWGGATPWLKKVGLLK